MNIEYCLIEKKNSKPFLKWQNQQVRSERTQMSCHNSFRTSIKYYLSVNVVSQCEFPPRKPLIFGEVFIIYLMLIEIEDQNGFSVFEYQSNCLGGVSSKPFLKWLDQQVRFIRIKHFYELNAHVINQHRFYHFRIIHKLYIKQIYSLKKIFKN